ncbi:MAG: hypothetical protein ABFD08_03105 [Syntrophomonas sp.]
METIEANSKNRGEDILSIPGVQESLTKLDMFHCIRCGKLLGKYRECKQLEIKCPRCRHINILNHKK